MKPVLQVVAKFNECRTRSIFDLYTYFLLKESIKVPLLNDIRVLDQENSDIDMTWTLANRDKTNI